MTHENQLSVLKETIEHLQHRLASQDTYSDAAIVIEREEEEEVERHSNSSWELNT